jgi:hypothetical protein
MHQQQEAEEAAMILIHVWANFVRTTVSIQIPAQGRQRRFA